MTSNDAPAGPAAATATTFTERLNSFEACPAPGSPQAPAMPCKDCGSPAPADRCAACAGRRTAREVMADVVDYHLAMADLETWEDVRAVVARVNAELGEAMNAARNPGQDREMAAFSDRLTVEVLRDRAEALAEQHFTQLTGRPQRARRHSDDNPPPRASRGASDYLDQLLARRADGETLLDRRLAHARLLRWAAGRGPAR
ncbi:hypothetical protein AB0K51_19095 [Kitasatospora sp. NPDC049285]|uniref:hypothetical protein n=1 Tax=Kitasatospora sp. NPDC049285 TaxID=3157096 RepID=UPI0034251BEC